MFSAIDKVKVLYMPHRGVAHARNKGVESANGEYIGFVDSDDYAEIDMYQRLYDKAISTGADIVICDYYEENVDGTCKIPVGGYTDPGIKNSCDIVEIATSIGKQPFFWFSWKAIFRRKMLLSNSIIFSEGILGEDTIFNLTAMLSCNLLYYINLPLYHYTRNPGSIMRKKNKDNYEGLLNANYIKKKEVYISHSITNYQKVLSDYALNHSTLMLIGNEMRCPRSLSAKIEKYKEIRNLELVSDGFKYGDIAVGNKKQAILLFLLKLGFYHLLAVIDIVKGKN